MGRVVKAIAGIGVAIVGVVTANPGLILSGVQMTGSALLSPKAPKQQLQERQAAVTTLVVGEVSREGVIGRALVGGSMVDAFNYGGKYGTDWEVLVIALADHRCDALEGFYVNDDYHAFTGDGAVSGFGGQLEVYFRPGTMNQTVPAVLTDYGPGWTANDNGAGVCHVTVCYKADAADAQNPVWAAGRARFAWVVRGKRCYIPRKDSTVGGSGTHRWNDPATWEWTENLIDCRYNYVRGFYAGDQIDDPTQLLIGRGLGSIEAPPANSFAPANLCDETVGAGKRYTVGGIVQAAQSFLEVDEMFAQACGGVIVQRGGAVEIEPGQAKTPVAWITDADLLVGSKVTFKKYRSRGDSEWINTVIPRYIEPSLRWADHGAPIRRVDADLIADKGPREETLSLPLVTSADQAGRVGEMRRRIGRLPKHGGIVLGPRFCELEDGDWIVWTSDRRMDGASVVFRVESYSMDEPWHNTLTLREIGASVYSDGAFIADQASNARQDAPPPIGAPGPGSWSLTAGMLESGGGAGTPALLLSGAVDDRYAQAVRFEYRLDGAADWIDAGLAGPSTIRREIVSVAQGAAYEAAVSYVVGGIPGDRLVLGPAIVGNAPLPTLADLGYTGDLDATYGADINANVVDGGAGGALLARSELKTILGMSSGIIGQGSGATANNLAQLNAAEGAKLGGISPRAGTSGILRPLGLGVTVFGNSTYKQAPGVHGAWDGAVVGPPLVGPCGISSSIVSWRDGGGWFTAIGLDPDPDTTDPTSAFLNGAFAYAVSDVGQIFGIELQSGGSVVNGPGAVAVNANSRMVLRRNRSKIEMLVNGVVVASRPDYIAADTVLYPKVYHYYRNGDGSDETYVNIDVQHGPVSVQPDINSNIVDGGNSYAQVLRNQLLTLLGIASGITGQGPGATAAGYQVLNNSLDSSVLRIPSPGGGAYSNNSGGIYGAIKIRVPGGFLNTMMRFKVDIYNYISQTSVTYEVGGYTATGTWYAPFANMVGPDTMRRRVRFGSDADGYACVWIGEDSDAWDYPQVRVRDFIGGYANMAEATYGTGWVITLGAFSAAHVSSDIAQPTAGEARFGLNILESPGLAATLANFKTLLGIASGFTGQGALATLNTLVADKIAAGTLNAIIDVGTGAFVFTIGGNKLAIGRGFGTSDQFFFWFGPNMALSAMTETNGTVWMKTNGDAYFGGSLSVGDIQIGPLSNTSVAEGIAVDTGVFHTNGGAKSVVASYHYRYRISISDAMSYSGAPGAQIQIRRRNGGSWDVLTTFNASGGVVGINGTSPEEPGYLEQEMSGSATFTDNAVGAGDVRYSAFLLTRTEASFTSSAIGAAVEEQQLSILVSEG